MNREPCTGRRVMSIVSCLIIALTFAAPARAQVGACCLPDGTCIAAAAATQCQALGGAFISGGTCANCADPSGACCRQNVCAVMTKAQCIALGLTFVGGPCVPNPCNPPGACCLRDGTCIQTTRAECDGLDGHWLEGASCNPPIPCRPPPGGACCFSNGSCLQVASSTACNGVYFPNTTCTSALCTPVGACCLPTTCFIGPKSACPAGGYFFPGVISCTPNPCPPVTGACCTAAAGCQIVAQAQCPTGSQFFPGQTCNPNPCPNTVPIACCIASGACISLAAGSTCDGVTLPSGTVCTAVVNCPRGGCCNKETGQCFITFEYTCRAHGLTYLGNGVPCTPNSCPPQRGACCFPGTPLCVLTTKSQCSGNWMANTPCAPNPCCPADIGGGGLSIDDLFLYFTYYFTGCP